MRLFLVAMFIAAVCTAAIADQPRVFITDSQSWEMRGAAGGGNNGWGGGSSGGARPQTAEIIKTFGEKCKVVTINNKSAKADYIVVLDHEGGKGWIRRDNKVAVFNGDGDAIVSKSTRSLGASVENACEAIVTDWNAKGGKRVERTEDKPAPEPTAVSQARGSTVSIHSQPAGADIEIDGAFVGSTPSRLELAPGEHTVAINKTGYKPWQRKIKVTGGEVTISPELEKM